MVFKNLSRFLFKKNTNSINVNTYKPSISFELDMKKIKTIIAIGIMLQLSLRETDFNLSTVNIDFLLYKPTMTGGIKYLSS